MITKSPLNIVLAGLIFILTSMAARAVPGNITADPTANSSQQIVVSQGTTVTFTINNGVDAVTACTGTFDNTDGAYDGSFSGSKAVTFGDDAAGKVSTCSITLTTQSAGGAPCTPSKTIKFYVVIPAIQISSNASAFENIDDGSENVCVGEQINLQIAPTSESQTAWSWTIAGTTITDTGYNPAKSNASAPTAFTDTTDEYLTYYYAIGGNPAVNCTVTIDGAPVEVDNNLNVETPSGSFTAHAVGAGAIDFYTDPTDLTYKSFSYGNGMVQTIETSGIQFANTYTAPDVASGNFYLAQVIVTGTQSDSCPDPSDNRVMPPVSNVLDSDFPAPHDYDYPGLPYITDENPNSITESGTYKDTILFLPTTPSSTYVPIAAFTWSYAASADKSSGSLAKIGTGTPASDQTGTAASSMSDFPTWTASFPP